MLFVQAPIALLLGAAVALADGPAWSALGWGVAAGVALGAFPFVLQNARIIDLNDELLAELRERARKP